MKEEKNKTKWSEFSPIKLPGEKRTKKQIEHDNEVYSQGYEAGRESGIREGKRILTDEIKNLLGIEEHCCSED